MIKLSGPVKGYSITFQDYNIQLYADIHNSTEGGCKNNCKSYDYNIRSIKTGQNLIEIGEDDCYDFPRYLVDLFKHKEELDFYIEYSFVSEDAKVHEFDNDCDYIDRISMAIYECLQRSKTHSYMPNIHVHYMDIRDNYITKRDHRVLQRCNPFSTFWLKGCDNWFDITNQILYHAWDIYEVYMFSKFKDISIYKKWDDLYINMTNLTSFYQDSTVHRVHKQFLKLDPSLREKLCIWGENKFQQALKIATSKMDNNPEIQDIPMILIPLSTVIMDLYVLSRMLYQSKNSVVFAGLAHIENYMNFFSHFPGNNITQLESIGKRCLISS